MVADFRLKQFGLMQGRSAMKVGTDALALGAWVASLGLQPKRILDVGTGTGILSLMLAQAYPEVCIDAIELDEGAILDAQENFATSPWSNRLGLLAGDALSFSPDEPYDLIVSNPPFYAQNTLGAEGASRQLARREQEAGLGLRSLIERASTWLSTEGCLCLVSPYDRQEELRQVAAEAMMYFEDLCTLYSKAQAPVRLLSCLRSSIGLRAYQVEKRSCLVLRGEDGTYTREYRRLTADYLLD